MVPRVSWTLATSIKLAASCGKKGQERGVAAGGELDAAIVGWAVCPFRVAPDCMVKASPVNEGSEVGILSADECIVVVVSCGVEVMATVAR